MNKEIIEKILLEISTPTGLTYSGDTTICNDEVKDITNYINDIEQQCKKQKEVIDKAIKLIKYNERYRNEAEVYQFVDIVSEILNPLQNILEQDETTNNAYLKEFEDWLKEVSE